MAAPKKSIKHTRRSKKTITIYDASLRESKIKKRTQKISAIEELKSKRNITKSSISKLFKNEPYLLKTLKSLDPKEFEEMITALKAEQVALAREIMSIYNTPIGKNNLPLKTNEEKSEAQKKEERTVQLVTTLLSTQNDVYSQYQSASTNESLGSKDLSRRERNAQYNLTATLESEELSNKSQIIQEIRQASLNAQSELTENLTVDEFKIRHAQLLSNLSDNA